LTNDAIVKIAIIAPRINPTKFSVESVQSIAVRKDTIHNPIEKISANVCRRIAKIIEVLIKNVTGIITFLMGNCPLFYLTEIIPLKSYGIMIVETLPAATASAILY
jgi:hypothetical protein